MNTTTTLEKAPENQVALPSDVSPGAALAALTGNIERLSDTDKAKWLVNLCKSVGLNPMSCPFDIINFKGVTKVYANKGCAEQLRQIHGVNIEVVSEEIKHGSYVVRIRAKNAQGRIDENLGAVPWDEKWGGDLKSLAMMKCHTKAARRVTLSICGLGMMDESEIDDMKRAKASPADTAIEQTAEAAAEKLNARLAAPKEPPVQEQAGTVEVLPPEKPRTSSSATEGGGASEGASASPAAQSQPPDDFFQEPPAPASVGELTLAQKNERELQTLFTSFGTPSAPDCVAYCVYRKWLPVEAKGDLEKMDADGTAKILKNPKGFAKAADAWLKGGRK